MCQVKAFGQLFITIMAILCVAIFGGCAKPAATSAVQPQPQQSSCKASDPNGNWVEVISIEPGSDAVLAFGDKVYIQLRYHLVAIDEPLMIYCHLRTAVPRQTSRRAWAARSVGGEGDRDGTVTCYIQLEEPAKVQSLHVSMGTGSGRYFRRLMECTVPYTAEWMDMETAVRNGRRGPAVGVTSAKDAAGNSLEIVSIESNSPASLAIGERLIVNVRYNVAAGGNMQVATRPSGKNSNGSIWTMSKELNSAGSSAGVLRQGFEFVEEASVTGIEVSMFESGTEKDAVVLRMPYKAEWRKTRSVEK